MINSNQTLIPQTSAYHQTVGCLARLKDALASVDPAACAEFQQHVLQRVD